MDYFLVQYIKGYSNHLSSARQNKVYSQVLTLVDLNNFLLNDCIQIVSITKVTDNYTYTYDYSLAWR